MLNKNVKGVEEQEFTFIGKQGSWVIDLVITNGKGLEKIEKFTVEKMSSDHLPIIVYIKTGIERIYVNKEDQGQKM